MDFLAPLMLLGLAGAAVPIIIHLIGRRRAPVKKFAAMDFLFGTNRRIARRLRLREILLLALRVLSCLAIALVLSKPFVSCSTHGVTVERGPQAVVLVLDDSLVMGYRKNGEALFDRARDRALRVLEQLGPEAEVALEHTAEGAEAAGELTRDHLRLRDAIGAAVVTARPPQTGQALRRAAALVAASSHSLKRVYLFSALQATGFAPGEPPWPGGAELIVVPIADGPLPNLAIVGATAEKEPDLGPRGVAVTTKVQSFGARVVDQAVTVRVAGKAVARGLVSLGPGESAQKRFSVALPPEARDAEVSVELDGDNLVADDRRYLRVELRKDVRVLLVDGAPSSSRHDDELFYVETALRPGDRADSALAVTTTTVDELARRHLSDYDAVFLCNVKALEPTRVADLAAWVQKGGGLLVTLGDNVDADAYNKTMAPLLVAQLQSPRQLAAGPKGDGAERAERIGRFEATHPVFKVFSALAAGLREARFWKIYLAIPTAAGGERATLAHFTGGAPALMEARKGEGRLLLFASTIDRDWNDLPIHPGFLPFVQEMARYLARSPADDRDADLAVGHTRALPIPPDAVRVDVTSPSGRRAVFDAVKLKGRTELPFNGATEPGFYEVTIERSGETAPRAGAAFAVNVDPRASDTTTISADELTAGAPKSAETGPAKSRRRVELWHSLAAALLLFLLSEAILTWRG